MLRRLTAGARAVHAGVVGVVAELGWRGDGLRAGVRGFVGRVVFAVAAALTLTAACVGVVGSMPALRGALFGRPFVGALVILATLGLLIALGRLCCRLSSRLAAAGFAALAASLGVALVPFARVAARSPVAAAIGVGVAALGVAALFVFGQRTRRDLGPWAPRLRMALVGALFALAANVVLLREPALDEAVQTVLAVVFAGHAGLDSQRLRQLYLARGERGNLLVLGAAHLYFDLVNVALALVGLLAGPR